MLSPQQKLILDELLNQFEKSWNIKFDGSKKTKCMLFEELVFGHHMNPSTAQHVVEEIAKTPKYK